jgi:hypothetical protein
MTMYQDLLALLRAGGTAAGQRIYMVVAPQGVQRPYVVMQRVSFNEENTLSGSSGLTNTRMQIDAYALTHGEASAISDAIAVLIDAWPLQTVSLGGQDLYEPDVTLHRIQTDYSIWHQ